MVVDAEMVEEARDPTTPAPMAGAVAGAVAGPDLRDDWLRVLTILRVCFAVLAAGLAIRCNEEDDEEEAVLRLGRCRERSVGGII